MQQPMVLLEHMQLLITKTQWGAAQAGRLPLDGAFGVDVFYSTEDGNMPYAIVTGQVSDGFQIFSLNDTFMGPVPYANRTSSDTGFRTTR